MDFEDEDYMQMMMAAAEEDSMMDQIDPDMLAEMDDVFDTIPNNSTQPSQQQQQRVRRLDFDEATSSSSQQQQQQQGRQTSSKRPRPTEMTALDHILYDSDPEDDNNMSDNDDDALSVRSNDDDYRRPLRQHQHQQQYNEDEEYILHRAPPGHYLTVTGEDGERVYLSVSSVMERDSSLERRQRRHRVHLSRSEGLKLVDMPVAAMLKIIDAEALEVKMADDEAKANGGGGRDNDDDDKDDELWVSKYAPKTYFELLSDEKINRDVLKWLKSWSPIVFRNNNNNNNGDADDRRHHHANAGFFTSPRKRRANEHAQRDREAAKAEVEQQPKILLLAGPPGLGKTTLAHVIATHLGYRPVEINASDDRSAPVLINRVRNAVEMQSMFGEAKPNCVILDEIDGAMGGNGGGGGDDTGAINALVKLVLGGGKDKNGRRIKPLNRPIICTCNNLYARALRPLRQIAAVQTFTAISKSRLLQRLVDICAAERLSADRSVLNSLTEMCNFDIRACLNALQFLSRARGHRITTHDLELAPIAAKDEVQDRFAVWRAVFHRGAPETRVSLARQKQRQLYTSHACNDEDTLRMMNMVESNGDYEGVMEGIMENYLNVQYGDPTFNKTVDCSQWLSLSDTLIHDMHARQHQMMRGYLLYCVVGVHNTVATQRAFRPQMPRANYYVRQLTENTKQVIDAMLSPESQFGRMALTRTTMVLDVASPLLDILHPRIRPVNFQLLNQKEKHDVDTLVDTMLSLKLSYHRYTPSRYEAPEWQLQPSLDSLARFDHLSRKYDDNIPHWMRASQAKPANIWWTDRSPMSPVVMEYLQLRIDHETVRRRADMIEESIIQQQQQAAAAGAGGGEPLAAAAAAATVAQSPSNREPTDKTLKGTPITLFGLIEQKHKNVSPDKKKMKKKGAAGGGGGGGSGGGKKSKGKKAGGGKRKRTFLAEHENKLAIARSNKRRTYPVRFKFHEGFTNAVRRPVPVNELLQTTATTQTTIPS